MIFPYRDESPSRTFPLATVAIILLNGWVFFHELRLGSYEQERFVARYGLRPSVFKHADSLDRIIEAGRRLLTFMFLHGSFEHFVGNMWFLWLFGDNVEARLGRRRYLLLYLLCGALGGAFHVGLNWGSPRPCVGASGAIAGVMGAYMMLFPRARIRTLVLLVIIPLFFSVPAWVLIGVWFLVQVHSGLGPIAAASTVAWWAHIGGFLAGVWLQSELKPERKRKRNSLA